MRYLIYLSLIFITLSLAGIDIPLENLKRLDPHGQKHISLHSVNITEGSECLVCHFKRKDDSPDKLYTVSDINERCITCHNKLPHSGLSEHLGKIANQYIGKINCITCHRSHRSHLPSERIIKEERVDKKSFVNNRSILMSRELKNVISNVPMLKIECTDCHGWDKLP